MRTQKFKIVSSFFELTILKNDCRQIKDLSHYGYYHLTRADIKSIILSRAFQSNEKSHKDMVSLHNTFCRSVKNAAYKNAGEINMTDYKYILFDLDGTLVDSAPGITESVKYALSRLGEKIPPYGVLCKFIGPPLKNGFSELCGLNETDAERAVEYYREFYSAEGIYNCSVYNGVGSLLADLKDSGKYVALATSKPEKFARLILEHCGIAKYFDFAGGASFDSTRSEKGSVIAYVLDELKPKNKKTDAVMVGDRFHDIAGAKQNGIDAIGVLYGFGSRTELEAHGAAAIAGDVAELRKILL